MKTKYGNTLAFMMFAAVLPASSGFAQPAMSKTHAMTGTRKAYAHRRHRRDMLVAYDAKDKRYYSVAYAKAHHMKDRGGDTLILIRKFRLPKEAKMSRAMHGKM